jgi:predicted transcriptional regulator with HTH domain
MNVFSIDPNVKRAINHSELRRNVVRCLSEKSEDGYSITYISQQIGSPYSSISGAIKGTKLKYDPEWSLINLNIVEEIKKQGREKSNRYKLTDFGTIVYNYINEKESK